MMRILHLIPSLGGGGAERQLAYLAGGLRTLGCEVHVATFSGGANLALLQSGHPTIHHLRSAGNYDPRILVHLVRLIREIRPGIVQTWLTQMDVFGGSAALLTGTPWIVSERSSGGHYPRNVRHWLRRTVGRHATAVIANSEPGLKCWEEVGRRLVVPNAVPFARIDAAHRDPADYGSAKVILFAGRLEYPKNVPNLIAALAEVVAQRDAVALLCGSGVMEEEVRAAIDATGQADRIRLMGFNDRLPELMKRADVLVAPSWFEGHPNVATEAAAAGCPLVLSDIPAHEPWRAANGALFARPDDPHAIAQAILQVLDDPVGAKERADRAREAVRSWSVESTSMAYLRIYQSICTDGAGSVKP